MPLNPLIPLQSEAPNIYEAVQKGQADAQANQAAQLTNAANAQKLQYLPQQLQTSQEQSQLDLQSTKLAQAKAHTQLVGQLIGSAVDQPTYDAAKAQATKLGIDVSDEPAVYDPNHVKSIQMGALDAAQKLDLAQKQLQMQQNAQKIGLAQDTLEERKRHDTASEAIAKTRPLVQYMNGAGAFADPAMVQRLGGAPNPAGTISAPSQLPAGTLTPPTVGAVTGAPSGTATLGAPSFAPNPAASPNATGVPAGVKPVSTLAGDASPSFYQRTPTQQALTKGVSNYDITPEQAFGRGNGKSMGVAATLTDFPGFDEKNYPMLVKVKRDYSPGGDLGKQVAAIDRLGQHIQLFDDMVGALNNGNVQAINSVVNNAKIALGDPNITNVRQVQQAIGTEVAKSLKGAGVLDAQGQEEQIKNFGTNGSPKQLAGAIDTAIKLVAGQANTLEKGYTSSFHKPLLADRLNPQTQATLAKHDPDMAKILGVQAPAAQAAAHPVFQTPQANDIRTQVQSGAMTYAQGAAALKALAGSQ